ncbi:proteasome component Ecm29p [[Candida] railenensis]|uniref:Proteasome component Ecm29p n=1 Tax=[Candida] railenensis TaxID=45579 RepID=A0A9P0W063_9ASCO|nr:proteasome component Ecm29p [[Candida] railenensis]
MESELALIDKVELRIALASNDAQFENSLKVYLAPLLLKLASPYSQVRQAILKIIQNVIPRITAARTVKLPVESLLDQVKNPKIAEGQDPAQVRLYSLLFISRGIERLDQQSKEQLIPKVLEGIHKFTSNVSARLFNIFCKLLVDVKYKVEVHESDDGDATKDLVQNDDDKAFICQCIAKFFLLQPIVEPVILPGLTLRDTSFLTRDAGVSYKTQQEITQVKVVLLEFLKTGQSTKTPLFSATNLRIPLLIASSDSSSSIKDPSEVIFKKVALDYEDKEFVDTLFKLLIGGEGFPPVKSTLQELVLTVLLKSKYATTHPDIGKVAQIGFGSENTRLKQITVQFIRWVSREGGNTKEGSHSIQFASEMGEQLKQLLLNEGWPKLDTSVVKNYVNTIAQRQSQYEALGELIKLNPDLINSNLHSNAPGLSYVEFFFQSLEGDEVELRSTIQDALSGLTVHLPNLSKESKDYLKKILKKYLATSKITESLQSCRYIAIKYINCCFPFSDAEARYLCILGTNKENRSDTIEESLKGLNPHWFNILQSSNTLEFKSTSELLGTSGNTLQFPDFKDMVSTVQLAYEVDDNVNLLGSMGQAVRFILYTLVMKSIQGKSTVIVIDDEWSTRLEKAIEVDPTVQNCLRDEISKVSNEDVDMGIENSSEIDNTFISFLNLIFKAFAGQYVNSGIVSDIIFGSSFSRLLSLSPNDVVSKLASSDILDESLDLLFSKSLNEISLSQLSQTIGIIGSIASDDKVKSTFEKLSIEIASANTSSSKYLLRSKLIASSYLISRMCARNRAELISNSLLESHLSTILKFIEDSHTYSLALDCVSQLSIFGVLGPKLNQVSSIEELTQKIKDEILKKVKKCDEKAVIALAHLSLSMKPSFTETIADGTDVSELTSFEQAVYDTHISKQTEFTFSSGEAFAILAAGWKSTILKRQLDICDETSMQNITELIPEDTSRLPVILDLVLKSCANTKPSLRRAGCIWLLSLVQFVGHLEPIKNSAAKIHVSFMRFLADRDELIQESASRGLSIVYEMGDYDLKDTLVKGLLKSFTDTTSTSGLAAGSVDHETELFDPDVLKTGDGSVSTYKDVLNLASDVGDPSLVYKFMSLAKSSALWSSRKGMAFGLGSILSKTSLDEMLVTNNKLATRLIPKLYRYKFDPSTAVAKSMQDIWNVLIKDSSKTINDHFDNILQELLKSMGNKEWRVRQASTTAMIDLLQVVTLELYESKLEEIWNMSFRVMDDIKESVRKEGNKLTKSLASTITRRIELSSKNKGGAKSDAKSSEFLQSLIPFLLGTKGLLSDAEDIRNFALETILKLVKVGGSTIKPFIPELIDNFINLMSTLEPQIVNYLVLNADKYNLKNDDIDAKRLQSVGQSPMMDAIEKMLDQLDDSMMSTFIVKLQHSIKKSIGLPSKVCGSKVLVSLVTRHLQLIKPYGDKLLKICVNQINDKNDAIASSYAAAAGYLCRICSTTAIGNYSETLRKLYFEFENDRNRIVSSIASESVAKYSKDKFESIASSFLPLAFIGKHDSIEVVKRNFDREWIENTSGNSSIKLYMKEIIELSSSYLNNSRSYEVRQILAKTIADMVNNIDSTHEFSDSTRLQLFELLLEGSKGKSWSGKEFIVEALILFSVKCKTFLLSESQGPLNEKIEKTIIVEIKRRNKVYQKQVIKLASKYIYNFNSRDLIEVYIDIMEELISDKDDTEDDSDNDSDAMDIDSKKPGNSVKIEEKRLNFIVSLFDSFNPQIQDHGDDKLGMLVFGSIKKLFESEEVSNSWRSKLTSCENISKVITKSKDYLTPTLIDYIFELWLILSKNCLGPKEIENIKVNFVRLSSLVIDLVNDEKASAIKQTLLEFKERESSNVVLTELSKII